MIDLTLQTDKIQKVKEESTRMICNGMKSDIVEVILYGSCARGDFTEDSDIDIAILTTCDHQEVKKYNTLLSDIATKLAMKYFVVVNFVCLPYQEFLQKKSWYPYFKNIDVEGEVLYG